MHGALARKCRLSRLKAQLVNEKLLGALMFSCAGRGWVGGWLCMCLMFVRTCVRMFYCVCVCACVWVGECVGVGVCHAQRRLSMRWPPVCSSHYCAARVVMAACDNGSGLQCIGIAPRA